MTYSDRFQALIDRAEQRRRELNIPGAAIGVLHAGAAETAGLGVTSVPNPLAVTPDTLFQVGSITKTFLGTVVMRLVERGQLDLDAPLRRYLPDLRLGDPAAQAGVAMRHLLTHTSGWQGDYFADMGWGDDALRLMVEERLPKLPQQTPLGATFSYNNAGFYLAGRVLEVLTGLPFERAMDELLIGPLGLGQTCFFPHEVMLRRFAAGHIQRDGRPELAEPWPIGRAAHPAGGIASTAGDLLRYAAFHMGDGAGLLRPETLAQMREPLYSSISILDHVGLTWFIRDLGGVRLVNHGGGTNGQIAALWLVPARGFALSILTNANNGGELTRAIFLDALGAYLGLADPAPASLDAPPERLDALAGTYNGDLADVVIERDAGAFRAQVRPKGGFPTSDSPPPPTPPPAPMVLYSDTCALVTDGPFKDARAEFGGWQHGRPAWVRFGGRVRLRTTD